MSAQSPNQQYQSTNGVKGLIQILIKGNAIFMALSGVLTIQTVFLSQKLIIWKISSKPVNSVLCYHATSTQSGKSTVFRSDDRN